MATQTGDKPLYFFVIFPLAPAFLLLSFAFWYNCVRPKLFKEKVRKEREALYITIAEDMNRKAAASIRKELIIRLIDNDFDYSPVIIENYETALF
ncbi:Oidioi.mRNA.OKI2018_I69.PAR.g9844.t1.cds [Oikopleura dioica]|uniref:Oidioi.mRNA.OKI2018_I69.PAR.g9844.t1.cds n=1 Tax=Oikopleura dioica TaxID=34765 RepID=A0ABN7RR92_OIKDI|nr:Oidioi.mRNA.OKI2018_I69.PAR.g9844.t1.cds [Oikopleura dioica]